MTGIAISRREFMRRTASAAPAIATVATPLTALLFEEVRGLLLPARPRLWQVPAQLVRRRHVKALIRVSDFKMMLETLDSAMSRANRAAGQLTLAGTLTCRLETRLLLPGQPRRPVVTELRRVYQLEGPPLNPNPSRPATPTSQPGHPPNTPESEDNPGDKVPATGRPATGA